MISNLLTPSTIKQGFLWSSWRKENATSSVSTKPLPTVCSCPLKTLACLPFPQLKTISVEPWCFVACRQQNQKRYSGIFSLVCSVIPKNGDLVLGAHWVFFWFSLMLPTPFREGSELGYEIVQFPGGQWGRDTEISKQSGSGSVLRVSTGAGNVLLSESFVFPCRTNIDQLKLFFITLVRKL